jgi:hypothetical protein
MTRPTLCGLIVLSVLLAGCERPAPEATEDPEAAGRLFATAAYVGAGSTLFKMLEPAAQETMTARAAAINEAAGAKVVEPADLFVSQGFEPRHIKTVSRLDDGSTPDRAQIKVQGHFDKSWTLDLVRVEGTWRVRLGSGSGA